jgi:hypothetical protein
MLADPSQSAKLFRRRHRAASEVVSKPPTDLRIVKQTPILALLQEGGFDSGEKYLLLRFRRACIPLSSAASDTARGHYTASQVI